MGKVTSYCTISGCTPDVADTSFVFPEYLDLRDVAYDPGPLTQAAWNSLIDEEEKKAQDDILAITCAGKDGNPVMDDHQVDAKEAANFFDSDIMVIPCSIAEDDDDDLWWYGAVKILDPSVANGADHCFVSGVGACLMVQRSALAILNRVTHGRVTAQKFWKMVTTGGRVLWLDYGEVAQEYSFDELPPMMPLFGDDDYLGLEALGHVEKVKSAIVHKGGFWIWMTPDRFPLQCETDSEVPILLEPSSEDQPISKLESLPNEILFIVASITESVLDLLSLTAVSRRIRSKTLGTESDRNALAKVWISRSAPWFIPYVKSTGTASDKESLKVIDETPDVGAITWTYLRKCHDSGSMRNRKRIWGVAERIEQKFKDLNL